MPVLTSVAQTGIRVDVGFYSRGEREKLLGYPTAAAIERLVAEPVNLPTAEFLTYYLFHKKRLGSPSYTDYRSIGERVNVALALLDACIEFNGHSIIRAAGSGEQLTEVSEHIGEAIGLAIVGRIHGLTEADWQPIAVTTAHPTFDYEVASDGGSFIEVENKGSSVSDNRILSPAVVKQKHRIEQKKQKLKVLASDSSAPAPLRYGTIVVADGRREGNIRCWLTDPPPIDFREDPRRFRLLSRMRFLRDCVAFISVRSQLASALATRVADMEALTDVFELANVPLLKGNGDPFDLWISPSGSSSFFNNKSRVIGRDAGGVVLRLSSQALLFLGIQGEALTFAAKQDFEATTGYAPVAESAELTVECRINRDTFRSWELSASIERTQEDGGRSVVFLRRGQIHSSSSGLVFGVLPL